MKKYLLGIIFLFFVISLYSQSDTLQKDTIIVIPKSYETSYQFPTMVNSGTLIHVKADHLFLVNNQRLDYYERLRIVLTNPSLGCDSLTKLAVYLLTEYEKVLSELIINSQEDKELTDKFTIDFGTNLNQQKKSLVKVENDLLEINQNYNDLYKYVKKQGKWNNIFKSTTIGLTATIVVLILLK